VGYLGQRKRYHGHTQPKSRHGVAQRISSLVISKSGRFLGTEFPEHTVNTNKKHVPSVSLSRGMRERHQLLQRPRCMLGSGNLQHTLPSPIRAFFLPTREQKFTTTRLTSVTATPTGSQETTQHVLSPTSICGTPGTISFGLYGITNSELLTKILR
jgi:hypothetical protein